MNENSKIIDINNVTLYEELNYAYNNVENVFYNI